MAAAAGQENVGFVLANSYASRIVPQHRFRAELCANRLPPRGGRRADCDHDPKFWLQRFLLRIHVGILGPLDFHLRAVSDRRFPFPRLRPLLRAQCMQDPAEVCA